MMQKKMETFIQQLEQVQASGTGYKSWGKVDILGASMRINDSQYLYTDRPTKEGAFSQPEIRSCTNKTSVHGGIYKKRKNIDVILVTSQENGRQVKETIPPILDDQAQLLGPSLRYLDAKANHSRIIKALGGRFAVNVSGRETICLGKSIEDAYVAAQLVEKTSKAFLEAKWLGGAKPINRIEAWVMHKFYLLKYSKESEKNK
jgi:ribulose-5-phosphate 4-epimerase/fuculose-1-phosphate aldolase